MFLTLQFCAALTFSENNFRLSEGEEGKNENFSKIVVNVLCESVKDSKLGCILCSKGL